MAEIKIDNIQAGQAANETVNQSKNKLQSAQDAAKSGFDALKNFNPDLGSKFVNELNSSITDMMSFLDNIYSAAAGYFKEEQEEEDDDTDTGSDYSGRDYSDVTHEDSPTDPGSGISEPTTEAPVAPTEGKQIDTSSLGKMKASDVDGFTGSLIGLAEAKKLALDELVMDDKYADELKKMLLESPYVPQEFKDIITDMDSSVVRQFLQSLLNGAYPDVYSLNTLNIGAIFNYLSTLAENNDITPEQLLTDPKYVQFLQESMQGFKDVINLFKGWEEMPAEEFQSSLSDVYDGDNVDELPAQDMIVTKSFVDYISEETEIPSDDLLSDKSYASTLKTAVSEFTKSLSFFHASSKFTQQGFIKNVTQILNGSNYKAFGMDDTSVNVFKEEMNALAKSNNTTPDKLLTDSSFADIVSAALMKSSSAKGVGNMFKKASSSYSQMVAKNLYKTEIKTESTKVAASGISAD